MKKHLKILLSHLEKQYLIKFILYLFIFFCITKKNINKNCKLNNFN